ncbi:MAG: hypothetical protein Rpha_1798 [Candidatus Ruthia sp. Apha_13_S6]|nr:hypothetical protein [Candidatus Ruthia sp. Apha_13_S6]
MYNPYTQALGFSLRKAYDNYFNNPTKNNLETFDQQLEKAKQAHQQQNPNTKLGALEQIKHNLEEKPMMVKAMTNGAINNKALIVKALMFMVLIKMTLTSLALPSQLLVAVELYG